MPKQGGWWNGGQGMQGVRSPHDRSAPQGVQQGVRGGGSAPAQNRRVGLGILRHDPPPWLKLERNLAGMRSIHIDEFSRRMVHEVDHPRAE